VVGGDVERGVVEEGAGLAEGAEDAPVGGRDRTAFLAGDVSVGQGFEVAETEVRAVVGREGESAEDVRDDASGVGAFDGASADVVGGLVPGGAVVGERVEDDGVGAGVVFTIE